MAGNPLTDPAWASDLANTVERVVGQVRDRATTPIVKVVRALVFGVVIVFAAFALLLLSVIVGVKLLQTILNSPIGLDHDSSVWVSYMVMAGILGVLGLFAMRLRRPKEA